MNKTLIALTGLVGALLLATAGMGCGGAETQPLDERELALFESKLAGGASVAEACKELDVLCVSTGFGCQAHELFCAVPTKDYICQQLAAACIDYPAACDVYNNHCQVSSLDAGVADASPAPDYTVVDGGWYFPDARARDAGPHSTDSGWWSPDYGHADAGQYYHDAYVWPDASIPADAGQYWPDGY